MSDPVAPAMLGDAVTAFLNGPYVLIGTKALKDIADKVFPKDKLPTVDAFIDRYINPALPVVLGAVYGYVTAPAGTSRMTAGINGLEAGLAMSGLYRTWGCVIHGK